MARREFSDRVRRQRWDHARLDNNGDQNTSNCEGCGVLLVAGAGKHAFDHHMPDGLGGPPIFENCRVLCTAVCHTKKTASDTAMMQKADKQRARHLGGKKKPKGQPMAGTKASGWKKPMNGKAHRR